MKGLSQSICIRTSKHETLSRRWVNVDPPSATSAHHYLSHAKHSRHCIVPSQCILGIHDDPPTLTVADPGIDRRGGGGADFIQEFILTIAGKATSYML